MENSAAGAQSMYEPQKQDRGLAIRGGSKTSGTFQQTFPQFSRRLPYRAAAAVQAGGYALGAASLAGATPPRPLATLARACGQFMLGNYSVGVGLLRGLRGAQGIRWDPVR